MRDRSTKDGRLRTTLAVLGAAALLLAAAELTAYAAKGKPLLLGKANTATGTTTLEADSGAALALRTKSTMPPLRVTSERRVDRLNADRLDGRDAAELETTVLRYTDDSLFPVGEDAPESGPLLRQWELPGLVPGTYILSWDVNLLTFGGGHAVECALSTQDFDRQWGHDSSVGDGGKIAVWLSGAAIVDVVPGSDLVFYCQAESGGIGLKQPLQVALLPVDEVIEQDLQSVDPN